MAVTRIKNNQITDASGANTQLGVNAAVKLQDYSITSTKIANSLVYGSDLTVSGNLTVNGTTTTVDTVNTLIKDPILTLADGQTSGTPVVDIGLLGLRGNQLSSFIGWNEGNTEFAVILSNTTSSNTTVNINEYGNFHANSVTVGGNLSVAGNITGSFNLTGNLTAGNLISTGIVSAVSNVIGGNITTAGLVSATGNGTFGNINTAGLITATGNVTGGNIDTAGIISATGNVYGNNFITSGSGGDISGTGNITAGNVSATGNVTANYFIGNISGNIDAAGSNTQVQFNDIGDILGASANFTFDKSTNVLTVSNGNIVGGNILTGGIVSATGNITGGNLITSGLASITGNVYAPAIVSNGTYNTDIQLGAATGIIAVTTNGNSTQFGPSGTITLSGASQILGGTFAGSGFTAGTSQTDLFQNRGGNVTVQVGTGGTTANTWTFAQGGSLLAPGAVSAVGNILTSGLVSASGNIISATNVNTPNVVATGNLELSGGNILLTPSGNIVVNSKNINGVAQPVQNNDVATKIYVDNMVSTQIAYHPAVFAATTANLATATGGTITYNQPNGAGNGIGATITTTGSFNLIDTANVQTPGTRILVKNEGNAALNGAYVWSNATVITRSTDADQYGPNSSEELSINDYFFVQSGNVNAGSAWIVDSPSGEITFGTSNIAFAQFSSSQTYTGGNGISLYGTVISTVYDNSTIGVNGSNQLYIPANAPLVTPNIGAATGTSLSVTGDVTAGTNLSAVANVVAGNVTTAGLISATGNITTANTFNGANLSLSGNVISALNATGNIAGGNLLTPGLVSATGNATAGNVLTGGIVSATGNVYGNNFITSGSGGDISGTGNITAGNILTGGLISATGNIAGGNISTAGNVTANYFIGNIIGNIDAAGSNTQIQFNGPGDILTANANFTYNYATNLLTVNGGNIDTGNLSATGQVVATGNITGDNFLTGGLVSAAGNATAGNINTAGLISATGNITGANIIGVTAGQFGNIVISGDDITDTNGRVNINTAVADVDFAVNGLLANVFYVDAGANTASFGNSTQTTNALVSFNTNRSIKLPVGITGERPATGVTGMFRFNSTTNGLEVYNNTEWAPVGSTVFTVIDDEQFNGDGSTVAFTLATSQTTNSCIVSINGVVQIPTSAYSVSTTTLTFTEAPAAGDLIDVREITTTTTVSALSNGTTEFNIPVGSGNATLSVGGTANVLVATPTDVIVTGNLTVTGNATLSGNILGDRIQNGTTTIDIQSLNGNANITVGGTSNVAVFSPTMVTMAANLMPAANVTYDLGSTSQRWKDLWLSNSTIYLGNSQISANATALIFTNPAGGQTVLAGATSAITGDTVSATGNITGGNLITTSGFIVNGGSNGVGNIGSTSTYFNTVFAKATSAQYADLAEKYVADQEYAPGTVVSFGGSKEVTRSEVDADRAVAGVVSTNPSYIMNATLEAEHVAVVAFTGRVPTSVTGTVAKGDLMVSNGDGTARAEADPKAGAIIGKALENFEGGTGTIEVVVGRF